jgi:hypothetical protein
MRVGWCVRDGDIASLTKAFRLSHCLWGGRFNPIIVVDNEELARHLIELFHVDGLFPAGEDEQCRTFAKGMKHLPWPTYHEGLFEDSGNRKGCTLLDIYHPVRSFYEEHVKEKSIPTRKTMLCRWTERDPCAGAFEAMFGSYPVAGQCDIDYWQFVIEYAAGKEMEIAADGALDGSVVRAATPNQLTTLELKPELGYGSYESGLFVGEADSFSHLVEFWNLRAADVDLLFFDPRFGKRFGPLVEELERSIRSLPPHPQWGAQHLQLWLKSRLTDDELKSFTAPIGIREVKESTWDDRVWQGLKVNPTTMYFSHHDTVAQISEGERTPTVTLQLGQKPWFNDHPTRGQHLVVTLKPTLNFSQDDRFLFSVPHIPELNEYFGRKHHLHWNQARAERDGLGIITELDTEYITLWGMERFSLFEHLFKTFGIAIELRQPGLVCEQLIRQMGGLQGCRAFKIEGVRKLIEQFGPTQTFTRSDAMRLIANVDPNGRADFSAYEDLYIEPRDKGLLKPDDAFAYLLKQGVFRVGIELECTSCQLKFWRSLDDAKTLVICEYCGREFNVAPQLKGEKWVYRPSGLFGRADHQEGGVPVALTLQQLDTVTHGRCLSWLPAINLKPITAPIKACETDFVLLDQGFHGRVQLVIGECKTNKEITDEDVHNLSKVADALPSGRFDVFIVFAKAGREFTPEEIQRCRAADSKIRRRTILLSMRELEPYFVYERAEKEFSVQGHAASFEGMVKATRDIYFEPRPKIQRPRSQ